MDEESGLRHATDLETDARFGCALSYAESRLPTALPAHPASSTSANRSATMCSSHGTRGRSRQTTVEELQRRSFV